MFENVKELLSARETLETVNEQLAASEAKLQELQKQLKDAEEELAARNETIAKKDDIVIAIHKQTTDERQKVVDYYDGLEKEARSKLNKTQDLLKKAETHFEDCERQVYCMANLYKAMRAAIGRYSMSAVPENLDITPEELEELRLTEESVGLKMHSYKMEDLHKMHEANNALIEQLLARYEVRLSIPADRVVFQLMTLGLRAELQQIINELTYGELSRAQVRLHTAVNKYMKIVSFGKLPSTDELAAYASELEVFLKENLRLEYTYLERQSDYEKRKRLFGDPDKTDEQE